MYYYKIGELYCSSTNSVNNPKYQEITKEEYMAALAPVQPVAEQEAVEDGT